MSNIFGRSLTSQPLTAIGGEGPYLIDSNGKRYLNCGDAAVSCLGHAHPRVTAAIHEQADKLAFAHTGFFTSDSAEQLATKLVSHAPEGINHVYLVSGGSEAMESAIKLARQYFLEKGEDRHHIIARRQSYHGNTLGALAAGGNEWRRAQFQPLLIEMSHIAPCYPYRDQATDETEIEYGLRVANELEDEILRVGPDKVMAFIAEPVVGATLGAVPAVDGYFARIREICDKYGILLILDEVMCGMGRVGSVFAAEQFDVRPDIIGIAKGLGAGYQPIGAMMCSSEIYDTIKNGSGFFQHGHTYMGHSIASAASLAVLETFEAENLMPRVRELGDLTHAALVERFGQHPNVGDIRGMGLFRGIELVADRETKAVFDPARSINKKVKAAGMDEGLVCYPLGGTIDGRNGDHILLAPPFILADRHITEMVDKLERAIETALNA